MSTFKQIVSIVILFCATSAAASKHHTARYLPIPFWRQFSLSQVRMTIEYTRGAESREAVKERTGADLVRQGGYFWPLLPPCDNVDVTVVNGKKIIGNNTDKCRPILAWNNSTDGLKVQLFANRQEYWSYIQNHKQFQFAIMLDRHPIYPNKRTWRSFMVIEDGKINCFLIQNANEQACQNVAWSKGLTNSLIYEDGGRTEFRKPASDICFFSHYSQ